MARHYFHDKVSMVRNVGFDAADERLAIVDFGCGDYGFLHTCKRWPDDREPDGEFIKVVAPRLTNHTVTGSMEHITVRASILCADCGIHGFVTDGRWESC